VTEKQLEFNQAMGKFHGNPVFAVCGACVAAISIAMQFVLLLGLFNQPVAPAVHLLAFLLAYILTDFINGVIHMFMDHYDNYTAFYGPLVAQFHLHHQRPRYKPKPLALVYFHETGAKVWLVPYLVLVWLLSTFPSSPPLLMTVLVYIGVLSSVAEVSHYLCHTSESGVARWLASWGILLSRKHHMPHHTQDNTNYAFLNGMSDPLINWIARRFYGGYKQNTDMHFAAYIPQGDLHQR
jgi:hypothetical protein